MILEDKSFDFKESNLEELSKKCISKLDSIFQAKLPLDSKFYVMIIEKLFESMINIISELRKNKNKLIWLIEESIKAICNKLQMAHPGFNSLIFEKQEINFDNLRVEVEDEKIYLKTKKTGISIKKLLTMKSKKSNKSIGRYSLNSSKDSIPIQTEFTPRTNRNEISIETIDNETEIVLKKKNKKNVQFNQKDYVQEKTMEESMIKYDEPIFKSRQSLANITNTSHLANLSYQNNLHNNINTHNHQIFNYSNQHLNNNLINLEHYIANNLIPSMEDNEMGFAQNGPPERDKMKKPVKQISKKYQPIISNSSGNLLMINNYHTNQTTQFKEGTINPDALNFRPTMENNTNSNLIQIKTNENPNEIILHNFEKEKASIHRIKTIKQQKTKHSLISQLDNVSFNSQNIIILQTEGDNQPVKKKDKKYQNLQLTTIPTRNN